MDLVYIILIMIALNIAVKLLGNKNRYKKRNYKYRPPNYANYQPTSSTQNIDNKINYTSGYKSKWMFTYNEKDAFYKIKEITDSMGLYTFAKVRLFDLIEPKEQVNNKTAHQWKIQAKHVDFVICDKKLIAKVIIELDDSSHDTQAREERDNFVNEVLLNCGYRIMRLRTVEPDILKLQLEHFFQPKTIN